ncbi:hypothetical protein [Roseibium sediminis]|uniref:hypothetical protein n=1 Tax=Roseibium sediminis TaxID=1775174 RepID=UPI00123C8480|nr:hypothetical protein [Roseibium sediminis]
MLLPYATTSSWKPWKTRVFDFRAIKQEARSSFAFDPGQYVPFDPPDHVYPEHCDKTGGERFMAAFLGQREARQSELSKLLQYHGLGIPDGPAGWDKVGDFIQGHIEINLPASTAQDTAAQLVSSKGHELALRPMWHSILIDIAICIGSTLETHLKGRDPVWHLDRHDIDTVTSDNLPALLVPSATAAEPAPLSRLEAELTQRVLAKPELAGNMDEWEQVVIECAASFGESVPEDLPSATELYLAATLPQGLSISPVKEMQLFFYQALDRRYRSQKPEPVPFSLGDMFRPGLGWPWSNHPGI